MKPQTPLKQIADQLRNHRTNFGISKEDLALKAHTGLAIITRLERGNMNPTIAFLQRIARALDTSFTITIQ